MELAQLSPNRPYVLRAFYDWLLDNQLTPHLAVNVFYHSVQVPMEFVHDGQIVLNIATHAVGNLELTNKEVRFNARFGGIPRQVYVPMGAVLAIYARENGAGMIFEPELAYENEQHQEVSVPSKTKGVIQLVEPSESEIKMNNSDNTPPTSSSPPRNRPFLRVVK